MKKTIVYLVIGMVILAVTLSGCAPSAAPVSPTITPSASPISATSTPMHWETTPTPIPGYTSSPDWLPASEIAFSVIKEPNTVSTMGESVLYLVHMDGTGLVQLANGPDPWNDASAWSPDGSKIIFASGSWAFSRYTLWVINADGSDPVQLTHFPPPADYPAWSADGTGIALAMTISEMESEIALMKADGSEQKALTNGGPLDILPAWAPNGMIFFVRRSGDIRFAPGDVFAINPDGTGLVQLTEMGYVGSYVLTPDGTKMAIYNFKDHHIELVPVSGGGPSVTLVDSDFGCAYIAMSWSPDGQALVMVCSDLEVTKGSPLYIFKADSSSYTTVPNIESAYDPAWRP